MTEREKIEKFLHDLRAPLARAKTASKLIQETKAAQQEELKALVVILLDALEEMDSNLQRQ